MLLLQQPRHIPLIHHPLVDPEGKHRMDRLPLEVRCRDPRGGDDGGVDPPLTEVLDVLPEEMGLARPR